MVQAAVRLLPKNQGGFIGVKQRIDAISCALGLSLFFSWPYCVFSLSSLFVADAHGGVLNNLCWIISLTTLIAAFSADYLLGKRLEPLFASPKVVTITTIIQIVANISMSVGGSIAGNYGKIVVITGAAITGLATSMLHLCWGRRLGDLSSQEVTIVVPVGYVGGFAATLFISLLPHETRFPVIIAIIAIAGLILGILTAKAISPREIALSKASFRKTTSDASPQSSIFSKVLTLNDYATLFFCFVCVSLVQDIYNPQRMTDSFMFAFVMLAAAIMSIAFVQITLRVSREITYSTFTRLLVPLCCLGLFLATILPRDLTFLAFALIFSTMMTSIMFLWISGALYQFLTPGGITRSLGLSLIIHYSGGLTGTLAVPLFKVFGETEVLFFSQLY